MSTMSMPVSLRRKLSELVPAPRAARKCGKVGMATPAGLAEPALSGARRQTLSWSELRTYSDCSLLWRLERDGAADSVASGLLFSTCFRAALLHFYRRAREGRVVPADEMMEVFEEQWAAERVRQHGIPVRWGAAEKGESNVQELATRMFNAFLAERVRRSVGEIVAVAEPFRVEVGGGVPSVVGVIDLAEIRDDEDGVRRLHLVQFKTASRRSTLDELGGDHLHLYAMAAHMLGLTQRYRLPLSLRYDQFCKTKSSDVISLAVNDIPRDFGRLAETIRRRWRGMATGVCFPALSWRCASCGFRRACAHWPSPVAASMPSSARENIPA